MPRHSRNEIKAGALIVVAFVLLCAGVYIVADFGALLQQKKVYHFSFDGIQGLKASDTVMYAGIKCGRVLNIAFRECPPCDDKTGVAKTRVLVTVEINADVPLRDRDKPKVTRGLTGNVYMDIVPYQGESKDDALGQIVSETSPEKPLMGYHYPSFGELSEEAQGVLREMRGEMAKVGRALDDVEKAAENVRQLTGNARDMVARNEKKVDPILDNAKTITEDVKKLTDKLSPEALATLDDIRETIKQVRSKIGGIMDRMTTIVEKLDGAADDVRVATRHGKDVAAELRGLEEQKGPVGKILENTRQATQDARDIVKDAKDVVVANRANVDGTIEELRQSAARLNLAMEDIRRNPWKLLTRNIEADAYTQNIYDAAMSFAEGARALSMTSANLENLLARKDADPRLLRETSDKLNKLVDEMAKLEKLLYEAMKKRP